MPYRTWRQRAASVVADVIARVGTDDVKLAKCELRKAYPFGERKYYPYQVWLDEVNLQLGLRRPENRAFSRRRKMELPAPGQLTLFDKHEA